VNDVLSVTGAIPVLSRHDGAAWHLHFHAPDATWAVSWAGSMSTALAIVLGSPAHDRLGVCSASVCDRVYVDVSRNGARRFCSTACQNRVKAAAFRERQKA
jgi:predicted RNA-binding Zn ribbon-like protein